MSSSRDFGLAAAWPIAARAQQPDRVRRIGILQNLREYDPVASALVAAFLKELHQSGWTALDMVTDTTRRATEP